MARIIKNEKFTVQLTEQTVLELLSAIKKVKVNPDVDTINVTSEYSNVLFEIMLETQPNSQESLGYKMTDFSVIDKFKGAM